MSALRLGEKLVAIEREARGDPVLLEPLQQLADLRALELAKRHHIVAADREDRRLPSLGKR